MTELRLPNTRYIKVFHEEENGEKRQVGLFLLDGSDEEIEAQAKGMENQYQHVDPHISIEVLSKEETREVDWRVIQNGCVPWEEAPAKIHPFHYSFCWN